MGKKAAPDGESRANRSGLRPPRFARLPPSGADQKDRKVMKDIWTPSKTIHQNGISSSVMALPPSPPPPDGGALEPEERLKSPPPPPPPPGAPPSITISFARISVIFRLTPSLSSHSRV